MANKILILGGTSEAAALAAELVAQGHDVTTSLAGRTSDPAPVAGKLRVGGFGGAKAMAQYLATGGFELLIDATHPFARQISRNAEIAAQLSNVPMRLLERPTWQIQAGDNWSEVESLAAACRAIPAGARVFLALGSQHVAAFAERDDVHFVVRMVDRPAKDLPLTSHELVIGKPPQTMLEEAELLRAHAITHLVCRNSGGSRSYAKIEAARALALPVIMLTR